MSRNKTINVFLIEDNQLYLEALKNHLKENVEDITIRTFRNGEDMLPHISNNPDVVVLDYMLHNSAPKARNGMSVLKKIVFRKPYTPVIVLSEQKNTALISQLIHEGAYDYVRKFENGFDRVTNHVRHIADQLRERRKKEAFAIKSIALIFSLVLLICICFYEIYKHHLNISI